MTKNEKLLKYLLGLGIAGSITLSGCSIKLPSFSTDDNRKALASEMSADSDLNILNVYNFEFARENESYYINFKGHFDNGKTGSYHTPITYIDHKDFCIKYEISKQEYLELQSAVNKTESMTNKVAPEIIDKFLEIVANNDPISAEEIEPEQSEHAW